MTALTSTQSKNLSGTISVPGDKSISHRALIFGAMAIGQTEITGLLEAEDVLATAEACASLGADVKQLGQGHWLVAGCGTGGFQTPQGPLDFGNSGTAARLMMGAIAGHPMRAEFIGDPSLSSRPMGRVLKPLGEMGLNWQGEGDRLPLTLLGTDHLIPISYRLPVPSAQVKSALLIAGLLTAGKTTIIEPEACRDHTERMLKAFGADIDLVDINGEAHISVTGPAQLTGGRVSVPGDPSSAAFLVASALICPESELIVESVLINPTRIGLYQSLKEMGADLHFLNERIESGEPVADIKVRTSTLRGVSVPAERAPSMIDEYPILAVLASFAEGTTSLNGLAELRVKECDRLQVTYDGLKALGISCQIEGDNLMITGRGNVGEVQTEAATTSDVTIATHMDHRIAMSFLVMGLAHQNPVTVDDVSIINTSFQEFIPLMEQIGAQFQTDE